MRVCSQEIFAPVFSIIPYDTIDAAITMANDSRYGLQAGVFTNSLDVATTWPCLKRVCLCRVFTNSLDVATRCALELEYGSVIINDASDSAPTSCPTAASRKAAPAKKTRATLFMR